MPDLHARDHIRKIIARDGQYLVSFPSFSTYFKIPDEATYRQIATAHERGVEITFTYDENMTILTVAEGG